MYESNLDLAIDDLRRLRIEIEDLGEKNAALVSQVELLKNAQAEQQRMMAIILQNFERNACTKF